MAENYFVELLGTRDGWPEKMTAEEEAIMQEHFDYLKALIAKKNVLVAGPVLEDVFGLIVLRVGSRDEAIAIMDQEPSVLKGVHTYRLRPMVVSLQAHHVPTSRYPAPVSNMALRKEIEIGAGVESVWHAWTTNEGARSFFASNVNIDLRPGGPMEIYFSMDVPEGMRGSEDCAILAFDPPAMLSFEWNAPPQFGALRDQRTIVVLQFDALAPDRTRVRFVQHGWGNGEGWMKVYEYFDRAWDYVLGNLKKALEEQAH